MPGEEERVRESTEAQVEGARSRSGPPGGKELGLCSLRVAQGRAPPQLCQQPLQQEVYWS